MHSPGMFPEGFCQKHTISLITSLIPCTAYPEPISKLLSHQAALSAVSQSPKASIRIPICVPWSKASVHKTKLSVPNCQQEELPPPVSLSTRVLMAQNTLLEEQGATQYIASLSEPILRELLSLVLHQQSTLQP